MLEFGKRYTWDEIISTYPNKYAIIREIERGQHQQILSAVLLDVANFEELDAKVCGFTNLGIECSWVWTKGHIQEGVFWF